MRQRGAQAALAIALVLVPVVPAAGQDAARAAPLLDVPYVAQTEALCGGASVAMVQRYWGARNV